eukprot:8550891-Alexandrium_andersonii.AAC.1
MRRLLGGSCRRLSWLGSSSRKRRSSNGSSLDVTGPAPQEEARHHHTEGAGQSRRKAHEA